MAGHSQFKNIMYRKSAQDAKRAKSFTKVTREITVAVREKGADPESNARLRAAMLAARSVNMPKDTVERAIKKALGDDDTSQYFDMRYEGFGPGGVAIIVEALTDNRNRTAPDVRAAFSKYGGNLGEMNSVSYQFQQYGTLIYKNPNLKDDAFFEAALNAGALDILSEENDQIILCDKSQLYAVRDQLLQSCGEPDAMQVAWRPQNLITVTGDDALNLSKLIHTLEDNDDVQYVFFNAQFNGIIDSV